MSSPPPLRQPTGVPPNWSHAIGGIWRLTARRAFSPRQCTVTSIFIVLFALLTLVSVGTGSAYNYFLWLTNAYLTVVVPVLAFLSGGALVRDDMSPAVVDYVLTRPIPRPLFVATRVVCHLACLQVWCMVALLALTTVGLVQQIPGAVSALPMLLLAQILVACAFGILGALAGTLTARYLVIGILYGGVIEVGLGCIPMQLNRISILHHVRAMLAPVLEGAGIEINAAQGIMVSAGFVALLSGVALAVALVIFSQREFAGARPKES